MRGWACLCLATPNIRELFDVGMRPAGGVVFPVGLGVAEGVRFGEYAILQRRRGK